MHPVDSPADVIITLVQDQPSEPTSIAEVAVSIRTYRKTVDLAVTVVAHGDRVNSIITSDGSLQDSIINSQLDFPSKLAHFITSTASLFSTSNADAAVERTTRIAINRPTLVADSIEAIATVASSMIRSPIRIDLIGEQGIDAGGVYREWLLLLNSGLIAPETGIFVCVDRLEQTFYLNPRSQQVLGDDHLAHAFAAGRLLGRSLLEGNVTGFHLSRPLLKIIVGIPVGFADLEYFDPEVYTNLKWLLENDGAEFLGLDFSVTEQLADGSMRVVELIEHGSDVDVTDANKREYVDCKVRYLLLTSVQDQLFAFLRGLYEVIPQSLLMLFDAEELDFVLSGSDAIDVDDWEAHTVTSMPVRGSARQPRLDLLPAYAHFWIVVRELSIPERRRLLQFATGSTRVPPGGFSSLTSYDGRLCLFELRGVPASTTHGCLHAHACFNRIEIPTFWRLKDLRAAVHAAVMSDEMGFTTD